MPTEIPPATVADILGTATATPEPAPVPDRSTVPPAEPAEPAAPVDCDAKGVPFDPERHLATKHPKTGCWMPRRKPASATGTPPPKAPAASPAATAPDAPPPPDLSDIAAAAQAPEPPKAAGPDRFDAIADVYCRAGIAGAMGLFGDEWAPDDNAEFVALRQSAAAYLRATNREDLPPGWALAFAVLTYAGKRLPRPKTQGRIAYFRAKFSAWWRGRSVARQMAAMPMPGGAAQ